MVDHSLLQLALRAKALTLTVATTGSASLSGTATGYARSSGSFITDGFKVGMEITATSGLWISGNSITNAAGKVITAVTATDISCEGCVVDAEAASRSLTV